MCDAEGTYSVPSDPPRQCAREKPSLQHRPAGLQHRPNMAQSIGLKRTTACQGQATKTLSGLGAIAHPSHLKNTAASRLCLQITGKTGCRAALPVDPRSAVLATPPVGLQCSVGRRGSPCLLLQGSGSEFLHKTMCCHYSHLPQCSQLSLGTSQTCLTSHPCQFPI